MQLKRVDVILYNPDVKVEHKTFSMVCDGLEFYGRVLIAVEPSGQKRPIGLEMISEDNQEELYLVPEDLKGLIEAALVLEEGPALNIKISA